MVGQEIIFIISFALPILAITSSHKEARIISTDGLTSVAVDTIHIPKYISTNRPKTKSAVVPLSFLIHRYGYKPYMDTTPMYFSFKRRDQCNQVVSSTSLLPLSISSCSLPSYCQNVIYENIDKGWWFKWFGWSTIGLCRGIPADIRNIQFLSAPLNHSHASHDDTWWQVINWEQQSVVYENIVFIPIFPTNFTILHNIHTKQYMMYPTLALQDYPFYFQNTKRIYYPKYTVKDGKICTPTLQSDRTNLVSVKTASTFISLFDHFPFPMQMAPAIPNFTQLKYEHTNYTHLFWHKFRFIYNYEYAFQFDISQQVPLLTFHTNSRYHCYTCNPYAETSSLLPISYSYFSHVISDILLVLRSWLWEFIEWLFDLFNSSFHFYNYNYRVIELIFLYLFGLYYFRSMYIPIPFILVIFNIFSFTRTPRDFFINN